MAPIGESAGLDHPIEFEIKAFVHLDLAAIREHGHFLRIRNCDLSDPLDLQFVVEQTQACILSLRGSALEADDIIIPPAAVVLQIFKGPGANCGPLAQQVVIHETCHHHLQKETLGFYLGHWDYTLHRLQSKIE